MTLPRLDVSQRQILPLGQRICQFTTGVFDRPDDAILERLGR